jgi:cytochrome c-type biogenesis protein CcmE
MKPKHKRMFFVGFGLALLGAAVALALLALQDTVTFFFTPSQAAEHVIPAGQRIRLGGLVEEKSVKKLADGVTMQFRVTDRAKNVTVVYKGVLPDLFREGQGVVVQGAFRPDHVFAATTVLAKHDARYMPKEVADALKKQGLWQPSGEKQAGK